MAERRRTRSSGPLDDAAIPVGGGLWRRLGANGALIAGYAILGAHVAIHAVAFAVALDDSVYSGDEGAERLALAMGWSTILAPLIGGCVLFIGELQRRGTVRRNPRSPMDATLPQASNTSLWRMVTPRWNALWLVVCGVSSVVLLVGANDPELGHDTAFGSWNWAMWSVNGIMLAGLAGQSAGTWLKKVVWVRHQETAAAPGRAERAEHPALARRRAQQRRRSAERRPAFWRWFSFRWRFDVWLCTFGAIGLWCTGWFLGARLEFPDDSASLEVAAWISGVAGVVTLTLGLWSVTQFWRAGEDLAGGESVA